MMILRQCRPRIDTARTAEMSVDEVPRSRCAVQNTSKTRAASRHNGSRTLCCTVFYSYPYSYSSALDGLVVASSRPRVLS
jgi:hypothetical protein